MTYALTQYPVNSHYAICLHPHYSTLRDIPIGESVIFNIREPISRFVSGFYSRKRQGQPKGFWPWSKDEKKAFEYFSTPNQLAVALSSSSLEERDRAHEAMKSIMHVSSSYWDWFINERYFKSRLPDIFFIGFQEKLTEDFEFLKSKLEMSENAHLPNDDVLAHKTPKGWDKTLTDEAIDNLKKWYKDDFKFISLCKKIVREHPNLCSS